MIEMGYSEPLSQLRIDAEWRLVNRGGLTRMVIIILLSDTPDALDIEVWELRSDSRRKTRNTPTTIPITANKLEIDYAANANPALTTPYAVFFDNAHPFIADIMLSHVQLSEMGHHISNKL